MINNKKCPQCGSIHNGAGVRCSIACKAVWQLRRKEYTCKNCQKKYETNQARNKNFCSNYCVIEYKNNIVCKKCGERKIKYKSSGYCIDCYDINLKEKLGERHADYLISNRSKRLGKNNPSYKTGLYINGNYSVSSAGKIHLAECAKYRKKFLEKHNYLFCELCGISNSIRYETHHIVYASEAPRHPQLHNELNMILLCIKCHNYLHKAKKNRNALVIKRGLEKLFNRKLIR
jgi:hypothetical protein